MWSTYINPGELNISVLLSDIVNDLIIIKNQSGDVYWPEFDLNSIGSLTTGVGYQIKMSAENDLILNGSLVSSDYIIDLDDGWGIIGYLHQECYNVEDMMMAIVDNLTILKDDNGNVYWPAFGLNSIGNMCPGEAYQIKTTSALTFSYPDSERFGFNNVDVSAKTIYFNAATQYRK